MRVPVHDVPELVGLDVAAATLEAEDLGFVVDASTLDRRDGTEAGEVLEPTRGVVEPLAEGETVSLTVSLGPTLVTFPTVAAVAEAEAVAALEAAGLVVGETTRAHDEEVGAGAVIAAAPAADQEPLDAQGQVPRGTVVDLTVSDGPAPRLVPEGLDNATVDEARGALAAVQLEAVVNEEYSETVPAGYIIRSSAPAGTELARGESIELIMSRGPAPVQVPDVRYVTGAMAEQRLVEAGLTVAGIEGPSTGMVLQTDPTPGEEVPKGTAVRIFTKR